MAVFVWRGFTPSDVFRAGTIETLETLRKYPEVNRIIVNAKDHAVVMHDDVISSVQSTVDYLAVARGNYRMAVVTPEDVLAKSSAAWYVESLNNATKKRFVARQYESLSQAFYGLLVPRLWAFFGIRRRRRRFLSL